MTRKDKELFEKNEPINIDWEQIIFSIIVVALVTFFLWLGCNIASAHNRYGHIAGANKQLAVSLVRAENLAKIKARKIEEERLEQERKEQNIHMAYETMLIERFGYLPSIDAIKRLKSIAMEEGGNTEPLEGIVAMFIASAHRVKYDGENPRYHFPNTIDEVISQKNQFDTYSSGAYLRFRTNEKVEQAWEIFLTGNYPKDFKYTQYYDDLWAWTATGYNSYFKPVCKIGNHYFGGLKD